jgi:thioredoxin-like negative regulator of GroEL
MTGPEHYTRAEQLLREVRDGHQEGTDVAAIIAAAQVHATLAQAATALIDETPRSDSFDNYRAWQSVAGAENGGTNR